MDSLARIFVLTVLIKIAWSLQVINPNADDPGQTTFTVELYPGDTQSLSCKAFYEPNESQLNFPVKWHKNQNLEDDPELGSVVATFGSLSSTYDNTGRFNVDLVEVNDRSSVVVNLEISGAAPEDSGYYFCYTLKDGVPLSIKYDVIVKVEHTRVQLLGASESVNVSMEEPLIFKYNGEGQQGEGVDVTCTAGGGYPTATLKLYIEGQENPITGTPTSERVLMGEEEGMQTISTQTSVEVKSLTLTPAENGKDLICELVSDRAEGTSSEGTTLRASRPISVSFGPSEVVCDELAQKASVGSKMVSFGCKFIANPAPETVLWTARDRPDVIEVRSDNTLVNDQYRASLELTDQVSESGLNVFETRFTILEVTEDHFHDYDMEILTDDFPLVTQVFNLQRGERLEPTEDPVGGATCTCVSFLLLSLTSLLFLFQFQ